MNAPIPASKRSSQRYKGRFARKALLFILPLSLLPILMMGIFIYLSWSILPQPLNIFILSGVVVFLAASLILTGLIWRGLQRLAKQLIDLGDVVQRFADGDWQQRTDLKRDDEFGFLANKFNQMANELTLWFHSLDTQTKLCNHQAQVASEISQRASSACPTQDFLIEATTKIRESFGFLDVSIFQADNEGQTLMQVVAAGPTGEENLAALNQLPINPLSLPGWVAQNCLPRINNSYQVSEFQRREHLHPETRAEIGLPLLVDSKLLGVLHIQSEKRSAFKAEDLPVYQTIAQQIAFRIVHNRSNEEAIASSISPTRLYQVSREISQAKDEEAIIQSVKNLLQETPLHTALSIRQGQATVLKHLSIPASASLLPGLESVLIENLQPWLPTDKAFHILHIKEESEIPDFLQTLFTLWKCASIGLIPYFQGQELAGIIWVGGDEIENLATSPIQSLLSLADMISAALERIVVQANMERRIQELEILNQVSETVSAQADLGSLYHTIHAAINQALGLVNFMIAIYDQEKDQIHIPYMFEGGEVLSTDPFPLGEGLTSIVIRNRQPLLLHDLSPEKLAGLGAKIVGAPAKSWLGVPLMVAGEAVGAIIIQDLEQENRFTEADQRLLFTLSTQVAGSIRNAYLLSESRRQMERERLLAEISRKVWEAPDMDRIMQTAIEELGKSLQATEAFIQLKVDD